MLLRASLRPAGRRVTAAAVYTVGTNVNSALAGCAAMADEVMRHTAIRFGELYADSSEGDALERIILDHVDPEVTRKKPSPAVVTLSVSRASSPESSLPFTALAGTMVRTPGGVEFVYQEDVSFGAGVLGSVEIEARANLAGISGNVDAGTITEFVQTPSDTGISVTNPSNAAGGSDIETDQDYLARARLEKKARVRGVASALETAALRVDGVKFAVVEELLDSNGDPNGHVRVIVADASGRANSILCDRVRTALLDARAAGVPPVVVSAELWVVMVTYSLSFTPGTNTVAAVEQLRSLTVSMVANLAPQEPLRRSMLYAIARTIPGAIVMDNILPVPASDLVPSVGQKIVTRSDLVNVVTP